MFELMEALVTKLMYLSLGVLLIAWIWALLGVACLALSSKLEQKAAPQVNKDAVATRQSPPATETSQLQVAFSSIVKGYWYIVPLLLVMLGVMWHLHVLYPELSARLWAEHSEVVWMLPLSILAAVGVLCNKRFGAFRPYLAAIALSPWLIAALRIPEIEQTVDRAILIISAV